MDAEPAADRYDRVKVIRWVDAEPAADRYDRVKLIRWVDAEPAADRYDRVKVIRWVDAEPAADRYTAVHIMLFSVQTYNYNNSKYNNYIPIGSGGASAVKEPRHFEVRKSSSQVTRSQGRSQDFTLWAQKLSAEGA